MAGNIFTQHPNELGESYKPAQIQIIKGGKYQHFATIDDPELLAPPTK